MKKLLSCIVILLVLFFIVKGWWNSQLVSVSSDTKTIVFVIDKGEGFSQVTDDLKKGDQIIIETFASKFIYEVIGIKVVDPNDLSIINAPEQQGRYVSLMTCVPPGLNFKRLVVLGKMI